jgi:5-methylcytosine-specific restriction endonuclease McrA
MTSSDPYASTLYKNNRRLVLERAGYRCQIRAPGCHGLAVTADHVLPLAAGGSHDLYNLRAACRHCNSVGGAAITNRLKAARRLGRGSRRW